MKLRKLTEEKMKFKYYHKDGEIKGFPINDLPDPESGWEPGRGLPAWNKGLTAETDDRVALNGQHTRETRIENGTYVAWNKGLKASEDPRVAKNIETRDATIKAKYGVDNISQLPHDAWNKGLTKEIDERVAKISKSRTGQQAWNKGKKIGSHWTLDSFEKRYQTQLKNGTLGKNYDTKAERDYLNYLLSIYDEADIIHPYMDKERYPFRCDFYIISEDKFIEIHANWTHGGRPYDPNDEECQKQLQDWQEKAKTSDYYKNAIYTWTDLDVRKLEIAKKNNLNFEMIY